MEKVDLHVHTNYSDGVLNVYDIFELAKKEQIKHLAITDHDTIANLKGAEKVADYYGLDLIKGLEITVGKPCNMHILGYGLLDYTKVESFLQEIKYDNCEICKDVVALLQKEGYDISCEEIYQDMRERKRINEISYKVARAKCLANNIDVKDKSVVNDEIFDKRAIAKYLVNKGYAKNNKEVYDKIMGRDCKCYIPINKVSAKQAIDLIKSAGGVAVLAHPFTIEHKTKEEFNELIDYLKELGLSGIEIINKGREDDEYTKEMSKIADEKHLIKTVGSDFHRTTDVNNVLGLEVEENIVEKLKEQIAIENKRYKEREEEQIR